MKRTLTLRREALTELTVTELAGVAGADGNATGAGLTCPILRCATTNYTQWDTCQSCCTASASC